MVGLAGDSDTEISKVDLLGDAVVLVVGSEGKGLSRLVRDTCDVVAGIPIGSAPSR